MKKIKLLIRRARGSTVVMDGVTYRFDEANDHTCSVEDDEHARRMLEQKPVVFVELKAPVVEVQQPVAPEAAESEVVQPAPDVSVAVAAAKHFRKLRTPKAAQTSIDAAAAAKA